jgi:hypothetical protein
MSSKAWRESKALFIVCVYRESAYLVRLHLGDLPASLVACGPSSATYRVRMSIKGWVAGMIVERLSALLEDLLQCRPLHK